MIYFELNCLAVWPSSSGNGICGISIHQKSEFSVKYFFLDFESSTKHNFTYGICDHCHVEYWPDIKTGNHTPIIFATELPLQDALTKVKKLVRINVYV